MSGWDTPSRPTWDPQDGPEDGTQAFSTPDAAAGDDDPWAAPAGSGWGASPQSGGADFGGADFGGPGATGAYSGPPPEFLTQEFEQRTPGASLGRGPDMPSWDLPVRDRSGRGRNGDGRAGNGDGRVGNEQNANGAGLQTPGWEQAPAWDEPQRQDAPRQDFGRADFGRQDFGRSDPARPSFGQDFGGQDFGPQDPVGQDFPRRQPGRSYYDDQPDFAAQPSYTPQPDQADQADQADQGIPAPVRLEQERAARMDPALQDFFGPAPSSPGYAPRSGQGPQGTQGPQGPQGTQGTQGRQGRQAPGRAAEPWDDRGGYQPPGPQRGSDGPGSNGGRGSGDSPGGRILRILAVAAVVVVVVAVGAYLLLHKTGGSNAANNTTPTVAASSPAAAPTKSATSGKSAKPKASANSHVSGNATADGWVLSTPSVADGFPIGTDPHFLATTTATAATIEKSAVAGGGGSVTGKPVAASYTLPANQTIEFVGYQGTFNPKTVMTNLGSFGSGEGTYGAGPHGGQMACANVPATATAASGGVCVWVTTTTLGVTEFFEGSGPEVLTTAQSKGAQDTVGLRASVEAHKS
jgi:hypothetical protein